MNGPDRRSAHQQPQRDERGKRLGAPPIPSGWTAARPQPWTRITTTRREQLAFDHGLMDAFPLSVGVAGPPPPGSGITSTTGLTMGYYDGNTVTLIGITRSAMR